MSERGPMCVLRACVVGAVAAACAASAGAAPATEGCTPRPAGPAPQGQHWYYLLDRVTKRQCWHLGALGGATQRSVTLRVRHRAATLHETAAAAATEANAEATEPARVAPDVTAGLPPAPAAQIMDRSPPAAPATARETHAADTPAPAPTSEPAPRPAAPARSLTAVTDETDHSFALMVLAAALLMIVGPVLALMRWSGKRRAGAASAAPGWQAAPVVVRVPALRRPTRAPDQRPEDLGESLRQLLEEALPKKASTPAAT